MNSEICILVIEPFVKPCVRKVTNELQSFQNIVGGNIEIIPYENVDDVVLIGNDNGKICGLPGNRRLADDVIVGTFFIAGSDGSQLISLTEKQIRKYTKRFLEPEEISREEIEQFMDVLVFGFHNYYSGKKMKHLQTKLEEIEKNNKKENLS